MKIFQAFSLLTIAHGSKVTRINFRKEGEGLGWRLGNSMYVSVTLRNPIISRYAQT